MYGLTPDDLELQARARGFADELIPQEEYAEAHAGELPADVAHRLEARAADKLKASSAWGLPLAENINDWV